MRVAIIGLALLAPSPTLAQEPPWSWQAEAQVVSDYRDRGYTLSDGRPAAQIDLTATHESGLYGGIWLSSIDDYGVGPDGDGARVEVTSYAGYYREIGGWGVDVGVWNNRYPDGTDVNYVEFPLEISRAVGPVTWAAGAIYAPAQTGLGDEDNTYAWTRLTYASSVTPLILSASIGHETGAFAPDGKTDWKIGAERAFGPAFIGLAWVDSDTEDSAVVATVGVRR